MVYAPPSVVTPASVEREKKYVKHAREMAKLFDVEGRIREFIRQYRLENKRILDVGSGRGYLQDVVADYTGLDISPTAARYYHKPFVCGTATAMPFHDGEFDAVISIWVLEHVPNPESALREIRRVVKPGGYIYLMPAWNAPSWAADGYPVRPYSDFGVGGKIIKASIPIRSSPLYVLLGRVPSRVIRSVAARFGPTRLHYAASRPTMWITG
jgi:SAM-dependent methyltransferase